MPRHRASALLAHRSIGVFGLGARARSCANVPMIAKSYRRVKRQPQQPMSGVRGYVAWPPLPGPPGSLPGPKHTCSAWGGLANEAMSGVRYDMPRISHPFNKSVIRHQQRPNIVASSDKVPNAGLFDCYRRLHDLLCRRSRPGAEGRRADTKQAWTLRPGGRSHRGSDSYS
jgi:hypothetical protein